MYLQGDDIQTSMNQAKKEKMLSRRAINSDSLILESARAARTGNESGASARARHSFLSLASCSR
jgi:hypothetical protein